MKKDAFGIRYIFAAGGTGGHLFPAVAVARQIKGMQPAADILFVGTKNKLEAKVIPNLGFNFKTIWISGFARNLKLSNLLFPLKLIVSTIQSLLICMKYKPAVSVGAGAYVSGPVIWAARTMGAKAALLEQNSFPGITNRLLEKKADKIFISYESSKKYFRFPDKLVLSGNPVRTGTEEIDHAGALAKYRLSENSKTLLVLGGSLGALSINEAVKNNLDKILQKGIQIIWQCGARYKEKYIQFESDACRVLPFIEDIYTAYAAADLVIARAGATTIAESANAGLAVIFVPSPNVAADHQKKNAQMLVDAQAAEMIEDKDIGDKLFPMIESTIFNDKRLSELRENIKPFAKKNAAEFIAGELIKMTEIV